MTSYDEPERDEAKQGEGDEPFARRWSRRKRKASEAADVEPAAETGSATGPAADAGSGSAPADEAPVLTDGDMPPVESLSEDADVSGFFSDGVSESLRKQALRRLFHMPKFQFRDGLDDYDDDFRKVTPLGDIVTSDMRLQAERRLARERDAAANDDSAAPAEEDGASDGEETARPAVEPDTDDTLLARGPAGTGGDNADTIGEADGD